MEDLRKLEQMHGYTCHEVLQLIAFDKKTLIELEVSFSQRTADELI
jgi:hypothetical protein